MSVSLPRPAVFLYGTFDGAGVDLSTAPVTVMDLETSGYSPASGGRIVEIALVTVAGGRIVDEWETLVDAGGDPGASHVHRISRAHLAGAPTFADIAGEVVARLDGTVVAAHNATFEERFLAAELAAAGVRAGQWPALCTLRLAKRALPGPSYKLAACCAATGVTLRDAHTALGDARATAEMLIGLSHAVRSLRFPCRPVAPRARAAGAVRVHTRADAVARCGGPPPSAVPRQPRPFPPAADVAGEG
ncbi:MAG TPA: 3'-5' exonuclease [Pilimelia sp.]|nr:3'-5' exonuclease [Pilimelia sp.]